MWPLQVDGVGDDPMWGGKKPGNELPAGSATHGISRDVNLSSVNARQSDKAGDKVFHPPAMANGAHYQRPQLHMGHVLLTA
eukprot:6075530-Amphidinium_carterae.1